MDADFGSQYIQTKSGNRCSSGPAKSKDADQESDTKTSGLFLVEKSLTLMLCVETDVFFFLINFLFYKFRKSNHWQKKNAFRLENLICEVKRLFRAFLVPK